MRWPEDCDWWRALRRRYAAHALGDRADAVRVGFAFGPRARERLLGGARRIAIERDGARRLPARVFASPVDAARLWVGEINASFARAGVDARLALGAVGRLRRDSPRPVTPNPREALRDLLDGAVFDDDAAGPAAALPPECWAARHALNALFVVVDWGVTAGRLREGGAAGRGGITPCPAAPDDESGRAGFTPVAVVDLRCALAAHAVAHELGHVLGLPHADMAAAGLPAAELEADGDQPVMSVVSVPARARRLEWMRPRCNDETLRPWHDAARDEAAWLRQALPRLAAQRLACAGECGGACAAALAKAPDADGENSGARDAMRRGPRTRRLLPREETTGAAADAIAVAGRPEG